MEVCFTLVLKHLTVSVKLPVVGIVLLVVGNVFNFGFGVLFFLDAILSAFLLNDRQISCNCCLIELFMIPYRVTTIMDAINAIANNSNKTNKIVFLFSLKKIHILLKAPLLDRVSTSSFPSMALAKARRTKYILTSENVSYELYCR